MTERKTGARDVFLVTQPYHGEGGVLIHDAGHIFEEGEELPDNISVTRVRVDPDAPPPGWHPMDQPEATASAPSPHSDHGTADVADQGWYPGGQAAGPVKAAAKAEPAKQAATPSPAKDAASEATVTGGPAGAGKTPAGDPKPGTAAKGDKAPPPQKSGHARSDPSRSRNT
jgi:hypothetical protein